MRVYCGPGRALYYEPAAHLGLAAAVVRKPTVRALWLNKTMRTTLSREKAFSGKTLMTDSVFSRSCEPCFLPWRHHFRDSCRARPSSGGIEAQHRTYSTERAITGNKRSLITLFRPLLGALSPFPCGFGEGTSTDPKRDPVAVFRPTRVYPFSSFLSSLRKRQSVPWAMIFWGLVLIIPASCSRRAWKRTVSSGSYSRQRL
jgi:hypothetical protein